MEKLCIDVRGFSDEKKKRVQDAFFELGYGWLSGGKDHSWLNDETDEIYYITTYNKLARGDLEDGKANTTYPELMRKAGMDESDPDAGKQEDLQSEKQAEEVAPKQIGELTLGVELTTDLQSVISDYLFLLDSIKDPYARGVIKSQLTDLTDLQYQQLSGENENA